MTCKHMLDEILFQVYEHVQRGRNAVATLNNEQMNKRHSDDEWSIAQIFDHMMISNNYYIPKMEALLDAAPRGSEHAHASFSLTGRMILFALKPGRRVPAPKEFEPATGTIDDYVVDRWAAQQDKIAELIEKGRGVDLSKIKLQNPIMKFAKMNLADCYQIMKVHTEYHLHQIDERAKTF